MTVGFWPTKRSRILNENGKITVITGEQRTVFGCKGTAAYQVSLLHAEIARLRDSEETARMKK